MVSERLQPYVTDVVIRNEVYGSDHCPLVIGIADHAQLPYAPPTKEPIEAETNK